MRLGLFAALVSPYATREVLSAFGQEADRRGFDTIWLGEHVVLFDEYDSRYPYAPDGKLPAGPDNGMLDPFVALAHLSATTERIRLGTGITILPQRNPVYLAKEAATLDWLSGGRLDLGVGVGWLREEYEAVAVPWEGRGARADEYLDVLKTCWCDEVSAHDGDLYTLPPARMYPKPIQDPHPPVHVGGESEAALRRVARAGQGWYGMNLDPQGAAERIGRLTAMLRDHGRDRDEVQVTIGAYFKGLDEENLQAYAEAGVDEITALVFAGSPEQVPDALDPLEPLLEAAHAA